jgi:periplasmic protein TonB
MAHTLGLRATSFAASAALLGLAVLGALSISVTLSRIELISPPPIGTLVDAPPEPPPPIVRDRPPQDPIVEDAPAEVAVADPQPEPINVYTGPVATPPYVPREITNPRWLQRPSDLGIYYPRRAEARGVTGEVVLDCLVSTIGRLDCDIVSETPRSWGFGEAALAIARDHRMAPATHDGVAVQGRYRMRVPFEVN